jgi:ubiquinone/menaquinone biosynthesis C-methylase UbiE
MNYKALNKHLGNIDLFLLDQILKGRFHDQMKILDAGCGEGRNLHFFLREGYDVYGLDKDPGALRMLHVLARSFNTGNIRERFVQALLEEMPFSDQSFDAVICISVLHFVKNEATFLTMMDEMSRVLGKDGILLIGMLTDIISSRAEGYCQPYSENPDHPLFLLKPDHYQTIIKTGIFEVVENLRIHAEPGVQDMAYFVLRKK